MGTEKRRRRFGVRAVVCSFTLSLVAGTLLFSGSAGADHIPAPPGDGQQFVWPVSSWIAANDDYVCCKHHSGTADLAENLFMPVRPARPGVVVRSRFAGGSYGVRIEHEGPDGTVYRTRYGHLVDEPLVEVGQRVGLDTVIGYLGRTGNANMSGPHIHFTIERRDAGGTFRPMKVPNLEIGTWVKGGEFIPGRYAGLDPITWRSAHTFDVRVTADFLRVYAETGRSASSRIGRLSEGATATVLETRRGQYRIDFNGQDGWIPLSGVVPVDSDVFGVRITASNRGVVRRGPGTSHDMIGVVAGGRYVTGYDRSGNWLKVMWPCNINTNRSQDSADNSLALGGCPARRDGQPSYFKYGWVGPAISTETRAFQARTRIEGLNVYPNRVVSGRNQPSCPCNSSNKLGEVGGIRRLVTVHEDYNGWYRVTNPNGPNGWVRGWYTAGRQ